MRFLICGLGSVGRRHLRNLRRLGHEDVVLYRTMQATLPDDDLEGAPIETDLERALGHWEPDAVLITNPTSLHLEVALPAAKAGATLLIEKPLSDSMDRIDDLRAAVQEGGGQVLVGYQFRFNPGLTQARRLLGDGAIGQPITARAHWGEYLPDWHPWEDYRDSYSAKSALGGGVILTLSHTLDYLRWLLGEVDEVQAATPRASQFELEVEEAAEIWLRYGTGALGSVHVNYNQRPPRHDLEIVGTRGCLRWSSGDSVLELWEETSGHWQRHEPRPDFERNDMFLLELEHFIRVLNGQEMPICDLEDGVAALDLALKARESLKAGSAILATEHAGR